MRLPPKWLRRTLIDPAVVLGVGVAVLLLPVWFLVALFVSRFVPGRWRILRIAWFLFLYLIVEALVLTASFVLWVASGLGWKLGSRSFQAAHYRLCGLMLRAVVGSARHTFNLSVALQDPPAQTVGDADRRPVFVLSRHAGPGDSMLLMDVLINGYKREPRIVLKDFLQWDPAVDVILNRLPAAFVPSGRKGGESLIRAIEELAGSMGRDDAFVIFPEGANFTRGRQARAIKKLREIGRPDLAERAESLQLTLPPRTTGVQAALAAQSSADVLFVGHAGLESFVTAGDIWRAMPMDTIVAARVWAVPADEVPPPHGQENWLYDTWAQIDQWITATLSETAEPAFDDS